MERLEEVASGEWSGVVEGGNPGYRNFLLSLHG